MFEKLSNYVLHSETMKAAKSEKMATVLLLDHLHEINRRKLFVDFGHSTLQKYVMKELGYSEGESWIRIQAMRLIEKAPEAKLLIETGELPITNAAIINQQANNEGVSHTQKLKESLGKSSRDLKEEAKPQMEKKIVLNERLLNKMKKLGWDQTELEIIEALLDEKLKQVETSKPERSSADESKVSRYIPLQTKREVLKRSGHKCEFKGCNERRNLQYDHIQPFALGGDRSPENIRMLCFAHNQRRAIQTFSRAP